MGEYRKLAGVVETLELEPLKLGRVLRDRFPYVRRFLRETEPQPNERRWITDVEGGRQVGTILVCVDGEENVCVPRKPRRTCTE